MKNQNHADYLLNSKPTSILIEVASNKGVYINKLRKVTDTSYDHMFAIVSMLEEKGLLTSEKKGRVRLLNVTEKGEELAKALMKLKCI